MTSLHYAVYVLGLLVAFLLLGFASPRRFQVKARRELPAPPDAVWPYLVEAERFPTWYPFVVTCEPSGGADGAVGSRRLVGLDRNRRLGEREEVVGQVEPMRLVALEHSRERWDGRLALWREGRLELRLAASPGGSTVTGSYWFDGVGYLGRMFCLLSLRKRHEADLRLALANLEKRLVEKTFPA